MQNFFDFSMESIDYFAFQDKDFREEKKKVQHIIQEELANQYKNSFQGGLRPKRNATLTNSMNETNYYHDMIRDQKQALKEIHQEKKDREFKPIKDKSIKVPKLYEFQLYDNYQEVLDISQEI